MKRFQFRIQSLLVIMAFVAVLIAWWLDHGRMQSRIDALEKPKTWEVVVFKTPVNGEINGYIKRLESDL